VFVINNQTYDQALQMDDFYTDGETNPDYHGGSVRVVNNGNSLGRYSLHNDQWKYGDGFSSAAIYTDSTGDRYYFRGGCPNGAQTFWYYVCTKNDATDVFEIRKMDLSDGSTAAVGTITPDTSILYNGGNVYVNMAYNAEDSGYIGVAIGYNTEGLIPYDIGYIFAYVDLSDDSITTLRNISAPTQASVITVGCGSYGTSLYFSFHGRYYSMVTYQYTDELTEYNFSTSTETNDEEHDTGVSTFRWTLVLGHGLYMRSDLGTIDTYLYDEDGNQLLDITDAYIPAFGVSWTDGTNRYAFIGNSSEHFTVKVESDDTTTNLHSSTSVGPKKYADEATLHLIPALDYDGKFWFAPTHRLSWRVPVNEVD
jgi:hypothetical protein